MLSISAVIFERDKKRSQNEWLKLYTKKKSKKIVNGIYFSFKRFKTLFLSRADSETYFFMAYLIRKCALLMFTSNLPLCLPMSLQIAIKISEEYWKSGFKILI